MYLAHFKLQEKPFQLNTDPRFLWLGPKHDEALATLRYGTLENKGLLLLTGDIGTGKTTLISALVDLLAEERVVIARLPDPGLARREFFHFVSRKFGIDRPVYDKQTFTEAIEAFLNTICAQNKKALLIIDEAQTIGDRILEEVRLLSNMECGHTKPLNIFLVGQNEFNRKLLTPANRALQGRIAVNYNLKPLTENETAAYIDHRLRVAGTSRKVFTDDAVHEIHIFSKGAPRQINILCDLALVRGYALGAKILDRRMIADCEKRIIVQDDAGDLRRAAASAWGGEAPAAGTGGTAAGAVHPTGKLVRAGFLALVILVSAIYVSYALLNSGLIDKYLPLTVGKKATPSEPPKHATPTVDPPPAAVGADTPQGSTAIRAAPALSADSEQAAGKGRPRRSPPLSVNTAKAPVTEPELPPDAAYHDRTSTSVHDPPAALAPLGNLPPVILSAPETAGETPVEALKSGAPKDDRRPAAPSRATSNPSDASPPVIPASRETDREMSPAMTPVPEDADETPAEALKSGAPKDDRRPAAPSQVPPNPSDTWQPPVSAAQKKPLVASDGPSSADRENDDGASPTGNPAREPKAPTPASTEVADPADIIKWLLEEKNKGASAPAPR